jgi:hypothetical protein
MSDTLTTEEPATQTPRQRGWLAALGFVLVMAFMPAVVPIVSPNHAPQAVAVEQAAPEKRCYVPIAGWLVQEAPCRAKSDFLTQSQKECLIGIGAALVIDLVTGGVLLGPAAAGAAVACGVKVLASTPS